MTFSKKVLSVAVVSACAGFASTASADFYISFDQQSAFLFEMGNDATTPAPGDADIGVHGSINDRVTGWESIWWPSDEGRGRESVDSPIDTTDKNNPDDPDVFVEVDDELENQGAVSALKVVGESGELFVPGDGSLGAPMVLSYVYHRNNQISGDTPVSGFFTDSTLFQLLDGMGGNPVGDAEEDQNIVPWVFNETPNSALNDDPANCANDPDAATVCDDVFSAPRLDFDPVVITLDGIAFEFLFDIEPVSGARTNLDECRADVADCSFYDGFDGVPFVDVYTEEENINFINVTVAGRLAPVPVPGTLSILGLGLAGLGLMARRRKAIS